MAEKIDWHKYGIKLHHCHPICIVDTATLHHEARHWRRRRRIWWWWWWWPIRSRRDVHLPSLRPKAAVYDSWPVRRRAYGYLPSHRASPPIDRQQITLLGYRGSCMRTAYNLPKVVSWNSNGLDSNPRSSESQVHQVAHWRTTSHTCRKK